MARRILGHGVEQLRAGQIGRLQTAQRHVERRHPRVELSVLSAEAVGQPAGDGGQVLAAGRLGGGGEFLGPAPGQPFLGGPGQGTFGGAVLRAAGHRSRIADRSTLITDTTSRQDRSTTVAQCATLTV